MSDASANSPTQTRFYVFHKGEQSGPLSLQEIATRVRAQTLDLNDYLYDEAAADWIFLAAHMMLSPLLAGVTSSQTSAPAPQAEVATQIEGAPSEWFALRGDLRFGPFSFVEVIRLLQDKSLQDSDYVWHAGLKDWQTVSELPEFQPEAIRKLRDSGLSIRDEVFFRRRHARIPHNGSVLLHNNQKVFRGKGLEISAGGAGVVLETSALEVGKQVFLHFQPAAEIPSFNAVCEITSRRAVNSADVTAPTFYGVKFIKIESKTTKAIEALAARISAKTPKQKAA